MRETWLNENQRLVSQDNFGNDIAAVEAATKKHEAIETDIMVSVFVWLKLYSLFRSCNDHAQILSVSLSTKLNILQNMMMRMETSQLQSAFLCSVKFARLFCKD